MENLPVPRLTGRLVFRELAGLLGLLVSDPRRGLRRLSRFVGLARARVLLRKCRCGALVVALGDVQVEGRGEVHIGDRVQLAGGMFATKLTTLEGATLSIEANTLLSYGVTIRTARRIRIGKRCQIASMVVIRDQNEHTIAPVNIGDDVWLAYGAIIEPGVTIGAHSVIGAGAVVRSDVPPFSLAQGNPATWTTIDRAPVSSAG